MKITVADLINALLAFDQKDAVVVVRDINGLDWFFEMEKVFMEGEHLIIDTDGVNKVVGDVGAPY